MEYLVTYPVAFRFDSEEESFDVTDTERLVEWLAELTYDWLADGGTPHVDDINVKEY